MKKILLSLIFLTGCTTTPAKVTTPEVSYLEGQTKTYRADCRIDGQIFSEDNLVLQKEKDGKFFFKASDGKTLALPQQDCFLTQHETESGFSPEEPRQRWVKCKLDKLSFVSDSLIYQRDEKYFYTLKRRDGQVYVLPRFHCSIYFYPNQYFPQE